MYRGGGGGGGASGTRRLCRGGTTLRRATRTFAAHTGPLPFGPTHPPLQVSFRNRVLILFDWLKTQVFGRDLSNY